MFIKIYLCSKIVIKKQFEERKSGDKKTQKKQKLENNIISFMTKRKREGEGEEEGDGGRGWGITFSY